MVLAADADGDDLGEDLVGQHIRGHVNRLNPHWKALSETEHALLVFQGPGSYVSPTVYGTSPAAPTWDFSSVHVHGVIEVIDDPKELRQLVRATVRVFEREVGTGWDMNGSLEYFDRLLPGIGGFQMEIRGVDSMFKLSQEQPPQTVAKVVDAFRACPREQELADLVERAAADGMA